MPSAVQGEPYTGHIRTAIRRRYALLPYLYTLSYQAHLTGAPIMRNVWPTAGRTGTCSRADALMHRMDASGNGNGSV